MKVEAMILKKQKKYQEARRKWDRAEEMRKRVLAGNDWKTSIPMMLDRAEFYAEMNVL